MSILSQGSPGQGRVGWPKPGSWGGIAQQPRVGLSWPQSMAPPWPGGQRTWGLDTFLPISRECSCVTSGSQNIRQAGAQTVTLPRSQAGSINQPHFLDMGSVFRKTEIHILVLVLLSCVALRKVPDLSEPL